MAFISEKLSFHLSSWPMKVQNFQVDSWLRYREARGCKFAEKIMLNKALFYQVNISKTDKAVLPRPYYYKDPGKTRCQYERKTKNQRKINIKNQDVFI